MDASASAVPDAGLLLEIDREYREKARAGQLRRIAPRRMNPEGDAWLPVLNRANHAPNANNRKATPAAIIPALRLFISFALPPPGFQFSVSIPHPYFHMGV